MKFGLSLGMKQQNLMTNTEAPTTNHVTRDSADRKHRKFAFYGVINTREFAANSCVMGKDCGCGKFGFDGAINKRKPAANLSATGTDIARADRRRKCRNPLQTRLSRILVLQMARFVRFPSDIV